MSRPHPAGKNHKSQGQKVPVPAVGTACRSTALWSLSRGLASRYFHLFAVSLPPLSLPLSVRVSVCPLICLCSCSPRNLGDDPEPGHGWPVAPVGRAQPSSLLPLCLCSFVPGLASWFGLHAGWSREKRLLTLRHIAQASVTEIAPPPHTSHSASPGHPLGNGTPAPLHRPLPQIQPVGPPGGGGATARVLRASSVQSTVQARRSLDRTGPCRVSTLRNEALSYRVSPAFSPFPFFCFFSFSLFCSAHFSRRSPQLVLLLRYLPSFVPVKRGGGG